MKVKRYKVAGLATKIVFISDLHDKPWQEIRKIIEKEDGVGLIALGGDICDNHMIGERALSFLNYLDNLDTPVVYCRGNHEIDIHPVDLPHSHIIYKESPFQISGMTVLCLPTYRGKVDVEKIVGMVKGIEEAEGFRLVLSHHPEYYPFLSSLKFDLMLSGHTHGGQWRIGRFGVYSPSQGLFPKLCYGRYGRLIVGAGTANTAPFPRLGNRREVVIVEPEEK